jgi:uncharacterized protein YkwD
MSNPTAQEQELLELTNRMRLNPQAELQILLDAADPTSQSYDLAIKKALDDFKVNINTLKDQWSKLTTAVAPVAWSSELSQASENHNQVMIKYDQQSHYVGESDSSGKFTAYEPDLAGRLTEVNYQYKFARENIYAYGRSVLHTHAGFAIDWGTNPDGSGIQNPAGHRNTLLANDVREVGISITSENNPDTQVGPLVVTQNFGNRSALDKKAWLLGVAFQDLNKDGWYQAGEGLKDVSVQITGIEGTNFSNTIEVADAGGYQKLLNPGKYRVDFVRDGKIVGTKTTLVDPKAPSNVKLDYLVIPVENLNPVIPNTPIAETKTPVVDNSVTPTLDNSKQVVAPAVIPVENPNPVIPTTQTTTPVVDNAVTPTTNQTVDNLQQVAAPISLKLKTTSSTTNLLDFRTDDSTSETPRNLTGKTIAINFTGVGADADYRNYGGFYRVEDTQGSVIDTDGKSYAPKDSGYLKAALRRSQVANEGVELDRNGSNSTINLKGGYIYAPFLVVNASVNDVLNSKNSVTTPQVYFDYVGANADGFQHTKSLGANKFGFEDLYGGGDRDYNDLVFQVNAKVA